MFNVIRLVAARWKLDVAFRSEIGSLEIDTGSSMSKIAISDNRSARYRQCLRQAGKREVLFQLPDKTLFQA
jgi:hypothetical protein